ncbi:CopG family transcriptional regulator [Cereibacter sphaeroides]|uniref:type II toxin-antitoxin system HicB family antitoxin n=1 Tax=Cereibacter sphaeroides TaxID=1063 RepID=UPI000E5C5592|nr:type II toxin-antitoxin system HicB family antitoxin [Cereibacter sphaeroides]RIA00713.1 CopG family transcriptional regulator [Cereibacter sphaeroides]
MQLITAVVHKEPDTSYGLTFPDMPGCFAAADDWSDISAEAVEALDLWFEDGPTVDPSPIDEIRAREEVRKALAEGASMMTFAYVPADGKLERVNISMDRGLLRAIDATASARGMTRSAFIAMVARREIAGF